MEKWGNDSKRDNLIRICEMILEYKERKKNLEIQLSEEKLRHDYIGKRKGLLGHKAVVYLACIFILSWLTSKGLFFFGIVATIVILWLVVLEIKMVLQIIFSSKSTLFAEFAEEHHLNTFQEEERKSSEKMSLIKTQIQDLEDQIASLKEQRKQIQSEEELELEKTAFLGVETSISGKFQLKEADIKAEDKVQLYEYLEKEEQYISRYLTESEGKLHNCEKEIIEIDENFEYAKKKLIFSALIFVLMIWIQAAFKGMLYNLTAVICFVVCLAVVFYLDHTCRRPVILYLIEHDSNLTKEYAFTHNMAPVGNKRKQMVEEIEETKKELAEVKKQKNAVDNCSR